MTEYKGIKTFDELVKNEHGKIGTDNRNGMKKMLKCSL